METYAFKALEKPVTLSSELSGETAVLISIAIRPASRRKLSRTPLSWHDIARLAGEQQNVRFTGGLVEARGQSGGKISAAAIVVVATGPHATPFASAQPNRSRRAP